MPQILESSFIYHLIQSNGVAFNDGGMLYSYEAGTTTPLATYQDSGLSTPHANPIILNSVGQPQNSSGDYAPIYLLSDVYKFVFKDAAGVTLFTVDNYDATSASSSVTTTLRTTFWSGESVPVAGQVFGRQPLDLSVTLPAGADSSFARARVAPTAEYILSIKKNDSEVGTITFAAASTSGTFSVASNVSFVAGDTLRVDGAAVADDTIRHIGVTMRLTVAS